MKVFGYEKNNEDMIELSEVSIMSDIAELKKLISYLESVMDSHSSVDGKTELCHSHFQDWDDNWKNGQPDIVIVTTFEDESK